MGIIFRVTEVKTITLNESQWYPARLMSVVEEMMTHDGRPSPKFKFNFILLDPPDVKGKEVNGLVNKPAGPEINEKHNLFKWITALRGGIPPSIDDQFNFPDDFLGTVVMIQVKNTPRQYADDSNPGQMRTVIFQNVKNLVVCPDAHLYGPAQPQPTTPPPGQTATLPLGQQGTAAMPQPIQGGAVTPQTQPLGQQPAAGGAQQPPPSQTQPPVQQPPPATAGGTVNVDGEDFECPF